MPVRLPLQLSARIDRDNLLHSRKQVNGKSLKKFTAINSMCHTALLLVRMRVPQSLGSRRVTNFALYANRRSQFELNSPKNRYEIVSEMKRKKYITPEVK